MVAVAAGYRKGLVSTGWPILLLSCTNKHREWPVYNSDTLFYPLPLSLSQLTIYHLLKLFQNDPAVIAGKKNVVSEQYDEMVYIT